MCSAAIPELCGEISLALVSKERGAFGYSALTMSTKEQLSGSSHVGSPHVKPQPSRAQEVPVCWRVSHVARSCPSWNVTSDAVREISWNCAHQGAVIRDIAGRRFTLALWTLYITVFGVVARDNNATTLLGTSVVDFSRTCVVVAVHDALRACTIWDVGDEVGMRAGWK